MDKRNEARKMNNKGFSLVELIVVIAIMAILIGIMAPNLIQYIERTNVSADIQLADTVRTAVKTAMMDPAVIGNKNANDEVETFQKAATATQLSTLVNKKDDDGKTTLFGETIAQILGESDTDTTNTAATKITEDWEDSHTRSKAVTDGTKKTITVQFVNNDVQVTITNTDSGDGTAIVVP